MPLKYRRKIVQDKGDCLSAVFSPTNSLHDKSSNLLLLAKFIPMLPQKTQRLGTYLYGTYGQKLRQAQPFSGSLYDRCVRIPRPGAARRKHNIRLEPSEEITPLYQEQRKFVVNILRCH